jgi:hypothetical protein
LAYGQTTAAHLTVSVTGQSLIAGLNNTVTITVTNDYTGYIAIYDVDIAVSLPSSTSGGLTIVGDNHWHYDSINYGQSVTVAFQVYASSSSAGNSYSGTITATYKQLGDVSYTTETHALGLSVTGYINLVVYGVQVTPSQINPGGNTTISGNVLNNGNLASYNANVTVESDQLAPGQSPSVFLGEVDPNIPRPFSVLIVFKPDVQPGNYSFTVSVSATDNNRPSIPIMSQATGLIQVVRPTQTGGQRGQARGGIVEAILAFLRSLFNAFFGSSFP